MQRDGIALARTPHLHVERVRPARGEAGKHVGRQPAKLRSDIDPIEKGRMRAWLDAVPLPGHVLCASVRNGLGACALITLNVGEMKRAEREQWWGCGSRRGRRGGRRR
jgi:hypothetical protein